MSLGVVLAAVLDDEARLFPDVTADRHGIVGAAYSKWYGRWARKIVADRRKVFHS